MMHYSKLAAVLAVLSVSAQALATETVTYTYDAKGRLVKSVRTGTINNGVMLSVTHDKADNRTRVVVAGSNK